jgi:trehalose 6-phosphate phosphatase
MSPDAVTQNRERWALFLDVNAALAEVAEMPQRLHVFERIKQLLVTLTVRLDGAVALISDRSLDDVDRVFSPLRFCVAGLHGCEYREANGCVTRTPLHSEQLMEARETLDALVRVEILPASCTTATVISLFMQQAPFARRIPVFVGDSTTSNSIFDVVNGFGGVLISVGSTECTAENDESSRVEDMVRWLEHVATHQPGCS